MNITNNTELVEQITSTGVGKLNHLELSALQSQAAIGVPAEEAHNDTSAKGVTATAYMKKYLTKTYSCMDKTCKFLEEVDQDAAKKNTYAVTWSQKLKLK